MDQNFLYRSFQSCYFAQNNQSRFFEKTLLHSSFLDTSILNGKK